VELKEDLRYLLFMPSAAAMPYQQFRSTQLDEIKLKETFLTVLTLLSILAIDLVSAYYGVVYCQVAAQRFGNFY